MCIFGCCLRQHNSKENSSEAGECLTTSTNRVAHKDNIVSQMDRGVEIKVLERDEFLRKGILGSGISSEVYLLERKSDNIKLAGKFFKGDVEDIDFLRETMIMHSCSSTCATIVNMVGIMAKPKCIVMEYYVHGSLNVVLQEDSKNVNQGMKTEFPFLRRLGYILDLCKAVTILHQRNICHRDIALRNLLLSDDKKHVLLSDFSLSRVVSSPMMKQATLTTIIPRWSAPETMRSQTTTSGRKRFEREYSLKSDIYSMGRTMYGIIDRGFNEGQKWQNLPSGFPAESKPSSDVFKRIDELWILILRCWKEMPKDRPQSWDLEDKVQKLVDNPLDDANDNDEYITTYSLPEHRVNSPNYEHPEMSNIQSPNIFSTMGKLFENDLMLSYMSLNLANPFSSTFDQESFNKGHIKNLMSAEKKPIINQAVGNPKVNTLQDQISSEYLIPYRPTLTYKGNTSDPRIGNTSGNTLLPLNKNKSDPLAPLNKNKSDQLSYKPHLKSQKGWRIYKRLGSLASIFSTTVSSVHEPSCQLEKNGLYCNPLYTSHVSLTSPTNIAYCGGRHFFNRSTGELGSSANILKPEQEPIR